MYKGFVTMPLGPSRTMDAVDEGGVPFHQGLFPTAKQSATAGGRGLVATAPKETSLARQAQLVEQEHALWVTKNECTLMRLYSITCF